MSTPFWKDHPDWLWWRGVEARVYLESIPPHLRSPAARMLLESYEVGPTKEGKQ